MRRLPGRLAVSAVLLVLGFLVVAQLRSQAADTALSGRSTQDLTVLVANLTTTNNQLRDEIATLQRQRDSVASSVQRGDTSTVQIRSDLARVQGWSGALPITGAGIRVTLEGGLPAGGASLLLNELRNAGAEGIAVDGIRVVQGFVVTGPAGGLSVGGVPLAAPLEVLAVGQPEALSGSLTRAGGPIAQLAAQYPTVTITVLPMDSVTLPATGLDLNPKLGHPRI